MNAPTDANARRDDVVLMLEFAQSTLADYGLIGFGVAALVTIWKGIVAPELQRSRQSSTKLAADLQRIADTTNETAVTIQQTAEVLGVTSSATHGTATLLKECSKLVLELRRANTLPTPQEIEAALESENES